MLCIYKSINLPVINFTIIVFILHLYPYGSTVWVNCNQQQSEQLENIQLEAARVVTGAIKGTPHASLYHETGSGGKR